MCVTDRHEMTLAVKPIKQPFLYRTLKFLAPYSPTILVNILCGFLQDLLNLNVTRLLIG